MSGLTIASFLPDIELPSVPSGSCVQLRESRGMITVVVAVHSELCTGCREYVQRLSSTAGEFDVWDARLLVLVPGSVAAASAMPAPFGKVLADEHCHVADPDSASVIVADRYGQVFEAAHAGTSHDLPSVRDLEQWLKYIGSLCPE